MCSGIYLLLPLHVQDLPVISESFPSSGRNGYPLCTKVTQQKGGPFASCCPALPTSPAFTLANSEEPLETKIWPAFSCLIVLTSWNMPPIQSDCLCLSFFRSTCKCPQRGSCRKPCQNLHPLPPQPASQFS